MYSRRGKRSIWLLAVLLLMSALILQGCGGSDKKEKSTKAKKEDPAETQRKKAVKKAKNRPEVVDEDEDDWLILVNKQYGLSEDYIPNDLVTLEDCDFSVGNEETKQLKEKAADALEEMIGAAADDDIDIVMRTGYRSYEYQEMLYNSYVATDGQEAADTYSGRPGYSEHQSGLCCDVGIKGQDLNSFTGTDAADWVEDNAHKYGFILRYPEGKEDITGYMYESWHIRYVGKGPAAYMHKHDMTLEEYLDKVPED